MNWAYIDSWREEEQEQIPLVKTPQFKALEPCKAHTVVSPQWTTQMGPIDYKCAA